MKKTNQTQATREYQKKSKQPGEKTRTPALSQCKWRGSRNTDTTTAEKGCKSSPKTQLFRQQCNDWPNRKPISDRRKGRKRQAAMQLLVKLNPTNKTLRGHVTHIKFRSYNSNNLTHYLTQLTKVQYN